jgi:hypothetical protein
MLIVFRRSNRDMKSTRLITGALLAICLSGATAASTARTNLGALPDGDFGILDDAVAFSQSFQGAVRSTLRSAPMVDGQVTPRLINANWRLSKAVVKQDAQTADGHAFADLTPGAYAAAAFGPARNPGVYATYRGSIAAVPEIQTWLMLLIGFALAAYQLHRKQKALGQQVLSDEAMSSA